MPIITLPWPRGTLHPNARPHWAVRAKHTARARAEAFLICRAAGVRQSGAGRVRLRLELSPPDRRRRDLPDAISALKASIDGIADALGVDDSRFVWDMPEAFSAPVKGGAVVIEIEPLAPEIIGQDGELMLGRWHFGAVGAAIDRLKAEVDRAIVERDEAAGAEAHDALIEAERRAHVVETARKFIE